MISINSNHLREKMMIPGFHQILNKVNAEHPRFLIPPSQVTVFDGFDKLRPGKGVKQG
jgi:hypothetical protein